ncbi:Uncharacterised protein [Mycobacterium tuberculosis]|nr:Uncharacterised protein [Mycobacterium tuberculosis]
MTSSIYGILSRQSHFNMVTIICNLIEHDIGLRVHLYQPVQTPNGFIQHIGNSIFTIQSIR